VGALLIASVVWFGADPGGLALTAGPFAAVVFLLSVATMSWTRATPAMFAGGLFLGLAFAEHPIVAFAFPGFVAMALGATLRAPADESGRLLLRALVGFVLGSAAILLALEGAPSAVLDVPRITTPSDAIHLWFGWSAPFWRIASPVWWPSGLRTHLVGLARNAGPIVLVCAALGVAAFLRGRTRPLRPFLLIHLGFAAALVLGHFDDVKLARALTAWSVSFWCVAALAEWHERRPRLARVTGLAGVASAAILFGMNAGVVDRSAERGIAWARDSFDRLPDSSILITANPVHVALAVWEPREGIDVLYRGTPTAPALPPERRGLMRFVPTEELRALADAPPEGRTLLLDPNLFFDVGTRVPILGGSRKVVPYGLSFEIVPMTRKVEGIENTRGGFWEGLDVTASGPPLALRDGLTPSQFYARNLAQSAAVYLDLDLRKDAEREHLIALSHPDANPTVAAYGFAQVLFKNRNFAEAVRTLETYVRDSDAGAVQALSLLAGTYQQLRENEKAIGVLRRALALMPADNPDRPSIEERIERIEAQRQS
jgi:hypothetical protein